MGVAASRQEAFWEACGFGHKERVRKFIEAGDIDVNWVSYTHDCCPIHVASQGKPEIVQMLLDANCNVNVKDIRGNLPLHHAAMKGHADIMQMLIDAGSEVNTQDKNGWTPLHCAAYWSHLKAVKTLLKNGADIHIQNKDERTPLHETARSQDDNDFDLGEIARSLIEAGSDVNAKSSDLGEADFTGLMFAAYHNHPEVASAFIDGGCEIEAHGTNFWTALHWAADRGNDEMVFLLLEAGADPTKKGFRGERPSDRAQSPEMKEVLLNAVNMFEELALLDRQQNQKKLLDQQNKQQSSLKKISPALSLSKDPRVKNQEISLKKDALKDSENKAVVSPVTEGDTDKRSSAKKRDDDIQNEEVMLSPCKSDTDKSIGSDEIDSDGEKEDGSQGDSYQGDNGKQNSIEVTRENFRPTEFSEVPDQSKHAPNIDNREPNNVSRTKNSTEDEDVSRIKDGEEDIPLNSESPCVPDCQSLSVEEEKDTSSEKEMDKINESQDEISKT